MINILNIASNANESTADTLEVVRLGSDATFLVPYTLDSEKVPVHFMDYPSCRGYVKCNNLDNEPCALCRIGSGRQDRLVMPFWSPIDRCIKVLQMSTTMSPTSLLTQIQNALADFEFDNNLVLLTLTKPTSTTFNVSAQPVPDKAKLGLDALARVLEDRPEADLTSTVRSMTNAQLLDIPEVYNQADLLGLVESCTSTPNEVFQISD